MQNEEIHAKSIATLVERYGVTHNRHVSEFFDKSQKNMFKTKEYIWKTGEISILQGFEPIVLRELENIGYSFDEVKTNYQDMTAILYVMNGKTRRYYPYFYIPSENLIIEVKSTYTLGLKPEENDLKFQAVKDTQDLILNWKCEINFPHFQPKYVNLHQLIPIMNLLWLDLVLLTTFSYHGVQRAFCDVVSS